MTETHGEGRPAGSYEDHIRAGIEIGRDRYVKLAWWDPAERSLVYAGADHDSTGKVLVGIMESHKDPEGEWCGGYALFTNVPEAHDAAERFGLKVKHSLTQAEPLTIAPSLQCRQCPSHGFIQHGRWC